MTTLEKLLSLWLASKNGAELPLLNTLDNSAFVIVYDPNTQLISKILKSDLGIVGASGGGITKIDITIDNDGQTSVTLSSKPDNIDLVINRGWKTLGTDFSYNNQTGVLSYPVGFTTADIIDCTGYQNAISKSELINITSSGQSEFYLNDKPRFINHLVLNRAILHEGTDFTYDSATGLLTIINEPFINQITTNGILECRKIF